MKQTTSMLLLLSTFLFGCVWPVGATELKIGVVNPQKILDGTKRGKKIKEMLADYVQARQRLIQSEETDLKKAEEELKSQLSVLTPPLKEEKERVFQQKMMAYQRRVQELEGEVQAKKREVLGEFTRLIEQAVQEIAEKEKIVLVLESAADPGTPILYTQASLDLTARVIKTLDGSGGE